MDREFYECERLDRRIQRCDAFRIEINEGIQMLEQHRRYGRASTEIEEECSFLRKKLTALNKLLAKTNEIKDGQMIIDVKEISQKVDVVCDLKNMLSYR